VKRAALFAAALLIAAAGFGLYQYQQSIPGLGTGIVALDDFEFGDLEGRRRNLAEWRGKLVLLNFWATWCPPCREEIPLFIDMQNRYGGNGLQIIGVAIDQPEAVVRYRDSVGMNYPVLLGESAGLGAMTRLGNGRGALPYSVIIDPSGRALSTRIGAYRPAELENLLQAALEGLARPKN